MSVEELLVAQELMTRREGLDGGRVKENCTLRLSLLYTSIEGRDSVKHT